MKNRSLHQQLAASCVLGVMLLAGSRMLWAGGTPENVLLIIDPADTNSLYVGNYYKAARAIPDANVLYMSPGAANFATFADYRLDAVFGTLANVGTMDHIDYVVVTPGAPFYVSAPSLVSDSCSPVTRFAISAAYTMAFIADEVLTGTLASTESNRYFSTSNTPYAFDSSVAWLGGVPSGSNYARRYFIGALLGYSGDRGNTVAETIAMIDRSVAADGTRPSGTFYFMNNAGDPARNVRAPQYDAVVSAIVALGGQAQKLDGVLPVGHYDGLGIMTGAASPAIDTADFMILPGAFCDHMTSYAARFDTSSQTKVSRWIVKGASGSWGTVEEPCNYTGKFPHARLHLYYFQGASLGEAAFRSVQYVPFQGLLYGDPLTRPFAYLPQVAVPDAPTGPVAGTITLTPTASTSHPTAQIAQFDLLVDGVLQATIVPGHAFVVDTTSLADGWHDLRVLAYDNTSVKSVGRWLGELVVDNDGHAVAADVTPVSGDWATPFVFNVSATGDEVTEVRIVQNGRVVAAAAGPSATLTVFGLTLGAGPVQAHAEALFLHGGIVHSAPLEVDVAFETGTPSGQAPVAFGYTKRVLPDQPFVAELPATCDDSTVTLTYEIVTGPQQAVIPTGQSGPFRLVRPSAGAKGLDSFTFRVTSTLGNTNPVVVTLDYGVLRGDLNCDGSVDFGDINPFVLYLSSNALWQTTYPTCSVLNGDINGDGTYGQASFGDINPFVALLTES
jgi:hypothetical protein